MVEESSMKVVVTGSEGYIGAVVTEQLLEAGHEVVGIDCRYFPRNLKCSTRGRREHLLSVRRDIRDVREEDLRGAEAVVHFAALSNDPMGDLNPEWTMEINHRATIRLSSLARKVGITRFVFSSSCSVYGAREGEILDEDSEPFDNVVRKIESGRRKGPHSPCERFFCAGRIAKCNRIWRLTVDET